MTPLLEVGTTLAGKYRIERLLAEGGMGIVYEGYHVELEQRVAVKVVRAEYAHHQEAVARFLNEARAIARLRGHHIAKVLDTGRAETGAPYMVLEYLEGRDLRTVLDNDGPLPVTQAVHYLLQTCEAVAEAHAVGLIHRDLKPDNLFISRGSDGQDLLKVIDFGISKRIDGNGRCLTKQGQSLGSPHYMAPEQMASPEQVDARADIWSLGVVLYELLTNIVPFSGDSLAAACLQVLTAEPRSVRELRSDVPAELERIIFRCLAKQRDDRYATVQELAVELSAFAPEATHRILPWLRAPIALAPAGETPTLISRTDAPLELRLAEGATSSIRAKSLPSTRRPKIVVAVAAIAALLIGVGIQVHRASRTELPATPERTDQPRVIATHTEPEAQRGSSRGENLESPVARVAPNPSAPPQNADAQGATPSPAGERGHEAPRARSSEKAPLARIVRAAVPAKSSTARTTPPALPARATPGGAPANDSAAAELVNPYPDLNVSKKASRPAPTNP